VTSYARIQAKPDLLAVVAAPRRRSARTDLRSIRTLPALPTPRMPAVAQGYDRAGEPYPGWRRPVVSRAVAARRVALGGWRNITITARPARMPAALRPGARLLARRRCPR
jgi:hypothetical protein